MITTIISDFSYVILLPKDKTYHGSLNKLNKTLSEETNYNFFDHFTFNEKLLHFYENLKDRYSLNVFTTDNIQNRPEVAPRLKLVFAHIYNAKELGIDKTQSYAYKYILSLLKKKPEEIVYIDDQKINVDAAKSVGFNVLQFSDNETLFSNLKKNYNIAVN